MTLEGAPLETKFLLNKMLHKIINLTVRDVRFPTSLNQHGSDAMVRSGRTNKHGAAGFAQFLLLLSHCSTQTRTIQPHMWFWTRTADWEGLASRSRWGKEQKSVKSDTAAWTRNTTHWCVHVHTTSSEFKRLNPTWLMNTINTQKKYKKCVQTGA